jgi:hypothetical protein
MEIKNLGLNNCDKTLLNVVLGKVLSNRCQILLSNYTFRIIFSKLTFSNCFVPEACFKGYLTTIMSPKSLLNAPLITILCQNRY